VHAWGKMLGFWVLTQIAALAECHRDIVDGRDVEIHLLGQRSCADAIGMPEDGFQDGQAFIETENFGHESFKGGDVYE